MQLPELSIYFSNHFGAVRRVHDDGVVCTDDIHDLQMALDQPSPAKCVVGFDAFRLYGGAEEHYIPLVRIAAGVVLGGDLDQPGDIFVTRPARHLQTQLQ